MEGWRQQAEIMDAVDLAEQTLEEKETSTRTEEYNRTIVDCPS
jgi:hypothetical protein